MRRISGLIRRLTPSRIHLKHLALLLVLGALAHLGIRASHVPPGAPADNQPARPAAKVSPYLAAFSRLRPRAGDHMVLPRIGFRWNFVLNDSGSSSQASLVPSFLSGADSIRAAGTHAFRFLLHLVGPGGKPEIVKETTSSEIHLDLKKDHLPAGECEWWVEACLPGQPPICSSREKFVLKP